MPPRTSFRSNANKDYLRSVYDKRIVEEWFYKIGRPLHYLGLPGPEILDIVEWQGYIGRFTTIEREENEQHLIFLRANVHDLEHRLHSLYGDFDEILRTGRDVYGHAPRWPYELINLDFYGGFLYRNLSRPRAFQKVIENQDNYECSFLLIVTYHLRDADLSGEKAAFLDDLGRKVQRDYQTDGSLPNLVKWYKSSSTPDAARQSLYLNSLLHEEGENARFKVSCRPPIVYTGTGGARMIHFVSTFVHQSGAHRAVSEQSLLDVLNLGHLALADQILTEPVAFPRVSRTRE